MLINYSQSSYELAITVLPDRAVFSNQGWMCFPWTSGNVGSHFGLSQQLVGRGLWSILQCTEQPHDKSVPNANSANFVIEKETKAQKLRNLSHTQQFTSEAGRNHTQWPTPRQCSLTKPSVTLTSLGHGIVISTTTWVEEWAALWVAEERDLGCFPWGHEFTNRQSSLGGPTWTLKARASWHGTVLIALCSVLLVPRCSRQLNIVLRKSMCPSGRLFQAWKMAYSGITEAHWSQSSLLSRFHPGHRKTVSKQTRWEAPDEEWPQTLTSGFHMYIYAHPHIHTNTCTCRKKGGGIGWFFC